MCNLRPDVNDSDLESHHSSSFSNEMNGWKKYTALFGFICFGFFFIFAAYEYFKFRDFVEFNAKIEHRKQIDLTSVLVIGTAFL